MIRKDWTWKRADGEVWVCSIALLLVCLQLKSDSLSYRRPPPIRFQSCNTTLPD